MLPDRHKLVSAYLFAEHVKSLQAEGGTYEIPDVVEDMGNDVWEAIGMTGYDRKAQEARPAQESDRFFEAMRSGRAPPKHEPKDAADPLWMVPTAELTSPATRHLVEKHPWLAREDAQYARAVQCRASELQVRYEMVQKLIMRMQKYHKRGVKILNPPECAGQSALDYHARYLDRR